MAARRIPIGSLAKATRMHPGTLRRVLAGRTRLLDSELAELERSREREREPPGCDSIRALQNTLNTGSRQTLVKTYKMHWSALHKALQTLEHSETNTHYAKRDTFMALFQEHSTQRPAKAGTTAQVPRRSAAHEPRDGPAAPGEALTGLGLLRAASCC